MTHIPNAACVALRPEAKSFASAAVAALAAVCLVAQAPGAANAQVPESPEPFELTEWNLDGLEDDFSLAAFRDLPVLEPDGEELGTIVQVAMDSSGRLTGIVVESGGFLDIGDQHFFIPWDMVTIAEDRTSVTVPIPEEDVDGPVFFEGEAIDLPGGVSNALTFLGDQVNILDWSLYGTVADVLFDEEGLTALLLRVDERLVGDINRTFAVPVEAGFLTWDPDVEEHLLHLLAEQIQAYPFTRADVELDVEATAVPQGPRDLPPVTEVAARADILDADGNNVGAVALVPVPAGLLIQAEFEGLPQGAAFGFHIHETGICDAPSFEAAGGHFHAEGEQHGFITPDGPHLGDLPNIYPDANGAVRVDFFLRGVWLIEGDIPLLDEDGAALVVHATADDYATDPAGAAGARIACGVVVQPPADATPDGDAGGM